MWSPSPSQIFKTKVSRHVLANGKVLLTLNAAAFQTHFSSSSHICFSFCKVQQVATSIVLVLKWCNGQGLNIRHLCARAVVTVTGMGDAGIQG